MKGGPTPAEGTAPDPLACEVFRVAYRTTRGETFSRLFRQEHAAVRFARKVIEHGGDARLHHTTVKRWREVPLCRYCHPTAGPHEHERGGAW